MPQFTRRNQLSRKDLPTKCNLTKLFVARNRIPLHSGAAVQLNILQMITLTEKHGILHVGQFAIIIRYPEGDIDSVPWPMSDEDRSTLSVALADAVERGALPECGSVTLPDGSVFDFSH